MVVFLRLAMVAQHAYVLRQVRFVGRDCTSLTAGPEILARIEAEGSGFPHRSRSFPSFVFSREVLGTMSLASIFYYDQVPSPGQLQNPIHVGRLSVEVNRHDRLNHPAGPMRNRPSGKLVL